MRWYRRDDMDLMPAQDPPFRSDQLRAHVDALPELQRHIISRLFFGGATLLQVAEELKVSQKYARQQKLAALERLQRAVLEDHAMGPVPAGRVEQS